MRVGPEVHMAASTFKPSKPKIVRRTFSVSMYSLMSFSRLPSGVLTLTVICSDKVTSSHLFSMGVADF